MEVDLWLKPENGRKTTIFLQVLGGRSILSLNQTKKVSETKTRHANIARIARNARIATIDVPEVNYCNVWVRKSILQSE